MRDTSLGRAFGPATVRMIVWIVVASLLAANAAAAVAGFAERSMEKRAQAILSEFDLLSAMAERYYGSAGTYAGLASPASPVFAEVERVRAAIEEHYRASGFHNPFGETENFQAWGNSKGYCFRALIPEGKVKPFSVCLAMRRVGGFERLETRSHDLAVCDTQHVRCGQIPDERGTVEVPASPLQRVILYLKLGVLAGGAKKLLLASGRGTGRFLADLLD